MNRSTVEPIARAVLYEGYLLYPYRLSALKNRRRWMFGRVCPRDWSVAHQGAEAWTMQTECLVAGTPETSLKFAVRFLQIVTRRSEPGGDTTADDGFTQSAVEREVCGEVVLREFDARRSAPRQFPFAFHTRRRAQPPDCSFAVEECQPLEGVVEAAAAAIGAGLYRCTISIQNLTPVQSPAECPTDVALLRSLVSAHTILEVAGGEFVSLLDPPEEHRDEVESCRNIGTFPVLVGPQGARTAMLSSPIILYDYPRVAAESPGDLFDSTEIDELLTLRIQTLTDREKSEMSVADQRARRLLERTDLLDEQRFLDLHGGMRASEEREPTLPHALVDDGPRPAAWNPDADRPACAGESGCAFKAGDRVRLCPRGGADAFDLLLGGSAATVVSVERDFEDRLHLCVVIDADPGKDFGVAGLPGHRFFFRPEEVELLSESENCCESQGTPGV